MVIVVGNIKGGVGKTTLAVNLAIALNRHPNKDVLLVDGDKQGTAMNFTELRNERSYRPYTAVALEGAAIRTQVRQMRDKYSDVVIDVGGRDTGSLRAALIVADIVVVPVQPRSFDLWAVEQMVELIGEARELNEQLRAVFVLNAADPSGSDNAEAASALDEYSQKQIERCPTSIVRRKAFPNAAAAGLSVLEHIDPKAIEEFNSLVDFVCMYKQ